jgi:NAD(P)-dependent dehydrogenase (short-subunit alcohol dehydrogenase family)
VTGTGGLGLETAIALARAEAQVIIAGRSPEKGAQAVSQVQRLVPRASVRFELVDLASLTSVATFADRMIMQLPRLDILVNNAAVMTPPDRRTTADGFELQFGTNYLGHFALTLPLVPLLRLAPAPRVVTLSSVAARDGRLTFDDLQSEQAYQPMAAYAQSKLACLMFAMELQRRSEARGWNITSIGAHPGISRTDLIPNGAGAASAAGRARKYLWFLFQPAAHGAWSTLFAATDPEAKGGRYYGPNRLGETRGSPALARVPQQALDAAAATRLWQESERLTNIRLD